MTAVAACRRADMRVDGLGRTSCCASAAGWPAPDHTPWGGVCRVVEGASEDAWGGSADGRGRRAGRCPDDRAGRWWLGGSGRPVSCAARSRSGDAAPAASAVRPGGDWCPGGSGPRLGGIPFMLAQSRAGGARLFEVGAGGVKGVRGNVAPPICPGPHRRRRGGPKYGCVRSFRPVHSRPPPHAEAGCAGARAVRCRCQVGALRAAAGRCDVCGGAAAPSLTPPRARRETRPLVCLRKHSRGSGAWRHPAPAVGPPLCPLPPDPVRRRGAARSPMCPMC